MAGVATTAAAIRTAPVVSRPVLARERVGDWRRGPGSSRAAVLACQPSVEALLAAIADHSPYLWRLATADPERLAAILDAPPDVALDAALAGMIAACASANGVDAAMSALRRGKAEVALLVALMDLGGVWDIDAVVEALTRFADAAVAEALRVLLREAARSGKLRVDPDAPDAGSGIAVLALGKGGGRELNYSSDIDLVVLYDAHAGVLAPELSAAPFYVRLTQQLVRVLGERTAEGYVLRVDLRLRPDPGSTAVAISLNAAFAYYEAFGQNWERAAFIKARPVAGDLALGKRFLDDLAPFIWRKYFDYAAIADIHAMKRQIHAVRGHAEVLVAGHDVKLGRGGIREIEFFVQTQQLIFGGRHPALRGSRTLEMLAELGADGWVSADAVTDLSDAYRFLRRIEHRLQMLADEQTQRLPTEPEALARFAAWAGYASYVDFADAILVRMRAVETCYARLFEHAPGLDVEAGSLVFTGVTADPETVETLRRLGFKRPEAAVETVRGWHFGRRAAVQSARAREILTDLVPALLSALSGSGDPDSALAGFDTALGRLPAAVELFAILRSNAALRELFADILGSAPRLAGAVTRRPHLLDIAADPAGLAAGRRQGAARVLDLDPALATEDFLDRIRDLAQEELFLVGVRLLGGMDDPADAANDYSDLASAVVSATLAHCRLAFEREHGALLNSACVVLAMGRLGSRGMTATSDLDLMLIYDADPDHPESEGPRKLDAARYYARLTQRLIAALTVTTRRGRLYEVDMRLRPSGRQGPLATRLSSFVGYQAAEAEIWEQMALTRARVIAGDPVLAGRVEAVVGDVLAKPRTDGIRATIARLRELVAREKGDADPWDLKLASGGLLDIDFLAQYLVLRHAADHQALCSRSSVGVLETAAGLGIIEPGTADFLIAAYRLYANVTQMARLTLEGHFDPAGAGAGLIRRLVAAADLPDLAALERELATRRRDVRAVFESFFPPASSGPTDA